MQNQLDDTTAGPPDARALLAVTLLRIEGLGAVGVSRLVRSFSSLDDLAECPLEQVLVRLRGIPGASAIAARIRDPSIVDDARSSAEAELTELAKRRVAIVTSADKRLSDGLDRLEGRHTTPFVFVYGSLPDSLWTRSVAFVVDGVTLSPGSFEHIQRLARLVLERGYPIITGARRGTDVVLSKIAIECAAAGGASAVAVADTGLARIDPAFRSTATLLVKSGGALLSPFDMPHGPFAHDLVHRNYLMVSLARAVVYCESPNEDDRHPGQFESLADFCRERHISLFTASGLHENRQDVHPLRTETDDEWVLAALENGPVQDS